MSTATIYPDNTAPGTNSFVCNVMRRSVSEDWATITAAAGNDNATQDSFSGRIAYASRNAGNTAYDRMERGEFLFYMGGVGGVPVGATGVSAVLTLFKNTNATDTDSKSPDLNIYGVAPASNTVVAAADFQTFGTTPYCDTPVTLAGWNGASSKSWTLNAAGLAALATAIAAGGDFKCGARNANFEVSGSDPGMGASKEFCFTSYMAHPSDTVRPKLVVTFTPPASAPVGSAHSVAFT